MTRYKIVPDPVQPESEEEYKARKARTEKWRAKSEAYWTEERTKAFETLVEKIKAEKNALSLEEKVALLNEWEWDTLVQGDGRSSATTYLLHNGEVIVAVFDVYKYYKAEVEVEVQVEETFLSTFEEILSYKAEQIAEDEMQSTYAKEK